MKKTICVVEDDAMIRESYQAALESRGYNVVTASDGAEGLEIIAKEKPDMALVDINMPVMDGIEMIEKMNRVPELAKIPVVILTNYDDQKTVSRASKFPIQFYLVKALYTPQKMVDIVEEVMCRK